MANVDENRKEFSMLGAWWFWLCVAVMARKGLCCLGGSVKAQGVQHA